MVKTPPSAAAESIAGDGETSVNVDETINDTLVVCVDACALEVFVLVTVVLVRAVEEKHKDVGG